LRSAFACARLINPCYFPLVEFPMLLVSTRPPFGFQPTSNSLHLFITLSLSLTVVCPPFFSLANNFHFSVFLPSSFCHDSSRDGVAPGPDGTAINDLFSYFGACLPLLRFLVVESCFRNSRVKLPTPPTSTNSLANVATCPIAVVSCLPPFRFPRPKRFSVAGSSARFLPEGFLQPHSVTSLL